MQFHHGKAVQHVETGRQGIVLSWYPWHEWIDRHGDKVWHPEMECFPAGKMMVLFSSNAVCMRWMHRFRPNDEGRALFLRQAPQWIGPTPPRQPFREGEVPPPPPAMPPAGTDSHGQRIRLGQRQRQRRREDRDRHVAAWHAQEAAIEARERQEADLIERLHAAADLAHLEEMERQVLQEREQYDMDEAADFAAAQEEAAQEGAQEVPAPMPPHAAPMPPHAAPMVPHHAAPVVPQHAAPMPHHAAPVVPHHAAPMPHHAAPMPPHLRFAPAHRDRHERLRDRASARDARDRDLSPLTFIASEQVVVQGFPPTYHPPV